MIYDLLIRPGGGRDIDVSVYGTKYTSETPEIPWISIFSNYCNDVPQTALLSWRCFRQCWLRTRASGVDSPDPLAYLSLCVVLSLRRAALEIVFHAVVSCVPPNELTNRNLIRASRTWTRPFSATFLASGTSSRARSWGVRTRAWPGRMKRRR